MVALNLSAEATEALRIFSAAANKSYAAGHPLDEQRWRHFIFTTHLDQRPVNARDLAVALSGLGWSEEVADHLATDFDSSRNLLQAYDAARLLAGR